MNILVTGGSGFLGSTLIDRLLARGERVISVSRHSPELKENLVPLRGDILKPNLGLNEGILQDVSQGKIEAVYHLAAIIRLGKDKDGSIWRTNVEGTRNVIDFCKRHNVPHLFFCSTAYTWGGRNAYERSKKEADFLVIKSGIPHVTIFKPSIILGRTENHFSLFISLLAKVHRRAELIRRKIEGSLHLPVIEPVFRVKGNPEGQINLIKVEAVAEAMSRIEDEGFYWLTNPNPPTIKEILAWAGEFIMVRIEVVPDFKPTPLEIAFQRMTKSFMPYLWGDTLSNSDIKEFEPITKEFIHEILKMTLLG